MITNFLLFSSACVPGAVAPAVQADGHLSRPGEGFRDWSGVPSGEVHDQVIRVHIFSHYYLFVNRISIPNPFAFLLFSGAICASSLVSIWRWRSNSTTTKYSKVVTHTSMAFILCLLLLYP